MYFTNQKSHHLKTQSISSQNSRCNVIPIKIPAGLYVCGLKTDSKIFVEIHRSKDGKNKWARGGTLPSFIRNYSKSVILTQSDKQSFGTLERIQNYISHHL